MLLEPKEKIIYGPVNSRRLGRSLGLNILPPGKKTCPFNCVYCQYGWTKNPTAEVSSKVEFPTVPAVVDALESVLARMPEPPAYITFSGNGEPTLHPDFGRMVEAVKSVRGRLSPQSKTAILSNSALVSKGRIREALSELDVRIMKLDCGLPEVFSRYNQPCKDVRLEKITEGLAQLKNVTIQTLLTRGKSGNNEQRNIDVWIKQLKRIKPTAVQVYTLDRGYPLSGLQQATKEDLLRIQTRIQQAEIFCQVYESRSVSGEG